MIPAAPDPRGPAKGREHRRRRLRRHGRRAYIRSVYFLPSLATLGNAICGFGAMYVAALYGAEGSKDPITQWATGHAFVLAAYLIFAAMVFDALDGRLARFARHTTDFGGQLDSLADVISFGAAPAYLALQVMKHTLDVSPPVSRLLWAVGALYMSCAAMRLARFNVSNEHGEQHHFSFLGLPSPGAAGAVASAVLLQQEIFQAADKVFTIPVTIATWSLAVVVLVSGLAMVSNIRYPHLVNRYLRGRRPIGRLVVAVVVILALVVAHTYTLAATTLGYMLSGLLSAGLRLLRAKPAVGTPPAK